MILNGSFYVSSFVYTVSHLEFCKVDGQLINMFMVSHLYNILPEIK